MLQDRTKITFNSRHCDANKTSVGALLSHSTQWTCIQLIGDKNELKIETSATDETWVYFPHRVLFSKNNQMIRWENEKKRKPWARSLYRSSERERKWKRTSSYWFWEIAPVALAKWNDFVHACVVGPCMNGVKKFPLCNHVGNWKIQNFFPSIPLSLALISYCLFCRIECIIHRYVAHFFCRCTQLHSTVFMFSM